MGFAAALQGGEASVPWWLVIGFVLVAALLLPLGLGLLLPSSPAPPCPWGVREVLFAFLVGLALLLLASELFSGGESVLHALGSTVAVLAGTTILAVSLALARDGGRTALGLRLSTRGLGASLMAYVLSFPAILALGVLWPILARSFGVELGVQPVLEGIVGLSGQALWTAILLAVVVAPALEEVLFRGLLQPLLCARFSRARGIVLTSVLFAMLHPPVAQPPVFALSLLLGLVRVRSGGLLAPWAVHGMHNAVTLLIGLLVPRLAS